MKNRSIKQIIYFALICLIVVSVIAQIVTFSMMSVINNEKKKEVSDAVVTYIQTYVEQKIETTQGILKRFYSDANVLDMLDCEDAYEREMIKIKVSESIDVLRSVGEDLPYVVIFNDDISYRLTNNIDETEYGKLLNVYSDYKSNMLSEDKSSDSVYCDFFSSNRYGMEEMYICALKKIYKYDFGTYSNVEKGTMMVASKINAKRMMVAIGGITGIDIKVTNQYTGNQSSFSMNYSTGKSNVKNSVHTLTISNTLWEISEYWQEDMEVNAVKTIQRVLMFEILIIILVILTLNVFLKKKVISPVDGIVDYLNNYNLASKQAKLEITG